MVCLISELFVAWLNYGNLIGLISVFVFCRKKKLSSYFSLIFFAFPVGPSILVICFLFMFVWHVCLPLLSFMLVFHSCPSCSSHIMVHHVCLAFLSSIVGLHAPHTLFYTTCAPHVSLPFLSSICVCHISHSCATFRFVHNVVFAFSLIFSANCANRTTAHVYFNTYQPANLDDTTSDGCLRMSSTLPQVPTRQLSWFSSVDTNRRPFNLMSDTPATVPIRQPRKPLEKLFILFVKMFLYFPLLERFENRFALA